MTMKAAETLCIVCLPPEEHTKNTWVTDLPKKITFYKGMAIKFAFLRTFKNGKMIFFFKIHH